MVGDEVELELLDELLLWELNVVVDCFFVGAIVIPCFFGAVVVCIELCFCDFFLVTLFVCAFIAMTHRLSDIIVRMRFIY